MAKILLFNKDLLVPTMTSSLVSSQVFVVMSDVMMVETLHVDDAVVDSLLVVDAMAFPSPIVESSPMTSSIVSPKRSIFLAL